MTNNLRNQNSLTPDQLVLKDLIEQGATTQEIGEALGISTKVAKDRKRRMMKWLGVEATQHNVQTSLEEDIKRVATKAEAVSVTQKYTSAINTIHQMQVERDALLAIKFSDLQVTKIEPNDDYDNEATAVIVASDWHIEEPVYGYSVNYMNEFNLEIAEKRIQNFARNAVKLINMSAKNIRLKNGVLALLGDFISGNIHEELIETNLLEPVDAAIRAKNLLIPVIEYILEHTELELLTIVCKVGNHGRITKKCRHSTEEGNSLELFIYDYIAGHFASDKRVNVRIENNYHTYVNIYGYNIRFHHGHSLSYNGGVGGLYIPVNKAIAQWNRGIKADLDVFGHWHQFVPTNTFICNGALIGYGPYALSIKAAYETPSQTFFLVDKKHGKTVVAPIFLED